MTTTLTHKVVIKRQEVWDDAYQWCLDRLGEKNQSVQMRPSDGTWYFMGVVFRFSDERVAFEFKMRFG